MSATILLFGIIILILLGAIGVYLYDKKLIKEIELYEKRLHKKGILKRHYIKKNKNKK